MLFDKMSMFCEKQSIAATASATANSKSIDLRLNGALDDLKVYAQIVGVKNTAGSITTKLQTSDDHSQWTDVDHQVQNDIILYAKRLPGGLKRYIRLNFTVTGTLNEAKLVTAGLVADYDTANTRVKVQTYPPLQDLAAASDTLNNA